MFGLGPIEIVLLGAIAVMLYGKRLPEVGRSVGKTVGDLRRQWTNLARELDAATRVEGPVSAGRSGSPPAAPAAWSDEDAGLVAGPRFDAPDGEG